MTLETLDEANTFLEQLDPYIIKLARVKIPRNVVPPMLLEDEIDEIVQKTRIKLWKMWKKGPVHNPTAYINTIIYTEVIDMVRRYKRTSPLPLNEDGELLQNCIVSIPGRDVQDPTLIVEQEESICETAYWFSCAIVNLPSRQQYALLWGLKKQAEDVYPVITLLKKIDVHIDRIESMHERPERQRLSSLLSLARKKLREQYASQRLQCGIMSTS